MSIATKFKSICLVVVVLCCASVPVLAVPATSQVPLDSWVYPALDKLSAFGLIHSSLQGSRPFSRYEAARQVAEAASAAEYRDIPPVITSLIARLERELKDSLDELKTNVAPGYIKPREIRLNYVSQDGQEAVYSNGGVVASQFPLNYNNSGIEYVDQNMSLSVQGEVRLGSRLLVELRPQLLFSEGDENDAELSLLDGRVALQLGSLEFSAGRQALWWGPGRHGSLVLTDNAEPRDMVRLTNPVPTLLPSIFKYLGPFKVDVFWSQLEEERVVPDPYFAGLRLNFKPLPWVELGASRTVMFGGKGRPDVDWDEFVTILGGRNLSGGEDTSNSLAAIDALIRLPFLFGAEIYGEVGGEDEANHFFSKEAYLAGLFLPQLEPSGRLSLRVEYADISEPAWYRHSQYRSGYTYEGTVMGHHAGGAARDTWLEIGVIVAPELQLALGFDYEERGLDQPHSEEYREMQLSLDWAFAEHYSLNGAFAYGRAENFNFVAGNDKDFSLMTVGLRGHW